MSKSIPTISLSYVMMVLLFGFLKTPHESAAQSTETQAPAREKRIEIAKQLLKETREKAIADSNSLERLHFFTQHWVKIEPQWTAEFMLKSRPSNSNLLYDHKAISWLAKNPLTVEQATLLKLIENDSIYRMMRPTYARWVASSTSDERLRERMAKIVFESTPSPGLDNLTQRLAFARSLKNKDRIQEYESLIEDYFRSGQAKKQLELIKRNIESRPQLSRNLASLYGQLLYYSPDDLKADFQPPRSLLAATNRFILILSINQQVQNDDIKGLNKTLTGMTSFAFRETPRDQMADAAVLGKIAKLDPNRAIEFARQAPNKFCQSWAQILIARELAKENPKSANQLIGETYELLASIDKPNHAAQYNYPPASIACTGLLLLEEIASDQLRTCVDTTFKLTKKLDGSRMGNSTMQLFSSIAILAKYDRDRAMAMFDEYSGEVDLHSAPGFFRAQLVLAPDEILDEVSEIPTSDGRGVNYRIQVTNAILPPLLASTDHEFWRELNRGSYLSIDDSGF